MTTSITENAHEFEELLRSCKELSGMFPDGLVYIDGIAVYLHAINTAEVSDLAEFTHDADLYISLADMADLRDIEEVTPNRRLSKSQIVKNGFSFDIYTERQSALVVPYDSVIANSVDYDGLRVACLPHLLALKLEAFRDRFGTSKGTKDAKDLIRIALIAQTPSIKFNYREAQKFMTDQHFALMDKIHRGPEFSAMARGNSMLAKKLRMKFEQFMIRFHRNDGGDGPR